MNPVDPSNSPKTQTDDPVESVMPDAEKRALLRRLGQAAVVVPVVTVLHDVSQNVAAAS